MENQINYSIADLLPHRPPMLLVDRIVCLNEGEAVTESVIQNSWPLVSDSAVDALILIELVAQTAGIHNGWKRDRQEGPERDKKGWIVGIKSADLPEAAIAVGTRLTTTTRNCFEFEGFREITGTVKKDKTVIAAITLQLLRSEDTNGDR